MKQYDVEYYRLESGSIRLRQDVYGDDSSIDLHPLQLRAIAEYFGLVAPQPPADELSKRLAVQLCEAQIALTDEQRHWSPGLASLWERLNAQIECLPSDLFPDHLWEDRQEIESKAIAPTKASGGLRQQSLGYDQEAGSAVQLANGAITVSGEQIGLDI